MRWPLARAALGLAVELATLVLLVVLIVFLVEGRTIEVRIG